MSQSTVHTVLLIEELAERIIGYTFVRRSPRAPAESCATLLALARVNKALSEAALGQLWLALESVQPLLSLLTPKLQQLLMPWTAGTIPAKKPRLPRAKDLARYVYYSRFVQVLDILKAPQPYLRALERSDYLVVEFGLNDQHYPHLKKLTIRLECLGDWVRYLALRTGPSTQDLRIVIPGKPHNIGAFKEIGKRCVNISEFRVSPLDTVTPSLFRQVFEPSITDMNNLEIFRADFDGGIITDVLRTLATLPKLRDIHLVILRGQIVEPRGDQLSKLRPGARNDIVLQCESHNPRCYPAIVKLSAQFSIFYSTVKFVSNPTANEEVVANTILSIAECQPEVRFVNFLDVAKPRIEKRGNIIHVNPDTFPLSSSTIMPLTRLRNLTDIDVDTCGPVMVTRELLDSLADSSPLLVTCHLSPYRLARSNQHMKANEFLVTLQDVVDFLNRCTRIWDVGIAFDGRKPKGFTMQSQSIPTSTSAVAHMHVGGSRIDDVEYVASLLMSLPVMGMAVIMPPDYLVETFLPTVREQELWFQVNGEYLLDRACGCGTTHDEE